MIIDTHVHLLAPENRKDSPSQFSSEGEFLRLEMSDPKARKVWQRASYENLLNVMDESHIDHALVFGFPWKSMERCRRDNNYAAECSIKANGKLWWLAVFHPFDGRTAVEELKNIIGDPYMIGVKIKAQFQDYSLKDIDLLRPFLEEITRHNKIALLHVQQPINSSNGNGANELLNLIENFPNLKVIAAHFGGMLGMYQPYPPVGNKLRNVYYDTAMGITAGEMAAVYASLGLTNKMFFGSDFPMHSPKKIINDLKHFLENKQSQRVLGLNFYDQIILNKAS
jgi:predicted TIM-barrel fold metal-dependent hydrolase